MKLLGHLSAALLFLGTASLIDAQSSPPRPGPFVDPAHDPYNPLKYIASNTLTSIAFSLVLIVAIIQTWLIRKYKTKWMLAMTIGAFLFAFGLSVRYGLHLHPQSKGLYIIEYTFIVLSPCGFIAADYVLLGQIAKHLRADEFLLVPSRRITLIFVISDISTFLVQAVGGVLTASSNDPDKARLGSHIFLAGLSAQLLSFVLFTYIYAVFLYRVWKHSPAMWTRDNDKVWYKSWLMLAGALVISCIGILIRSTYRVVELSEGFQGRLTRSEPFFYGMDTLPLFIAISVYIPFWPGRFIPATEDFVEEKTVVLSD